MEDPDEVTEVMKNVVLFPMFDVHLETKEMDLCDYTFTGTADEIVTKIQKLLDYRKKQRRRLYNLDLGDPHLDLRTLYSTLEPLLALYPQDTGTDQAGYQKEMGATYSARYPVMFHGGRLHMGLSLLVKAQKPKGMSIPPMMDTSSPAELLLAFLRGEEKEIGAWIALFYDTPLHALMWFYNFLFQTKLCDDFTMNTKCRERFQAWEDGNRSHQTFHWCLFLLCFPGAGRFHDGAVDQKSGHMMRYYTDVSAIDTDAGWSVGGYSDRFEKKFGKNRQIYQSWKESSHRMELRTVEEICGRIAVQCPRWTLQ
jgi:hypothetical protein